MRRIGRLALAIPATLFRWTLEILGWVLMLGLSWVAAAIWDRPIARVVTLALLLVAVAGLAWWLARRWRRASPEP